MTTNPRINTNDPETQEDIATAIATLENHIAETGIPFYEAIQFLGELQTGGEPQTTMAEEHKPSQNEQNWLENFLDEKSLKHYDLDKLDEHGTVFMYIGDLALYFLADLDALAFIAERFSNEAVNFEELNRDYDWPNQVEDITQFHMEMLNLQPAALDTLNLKLVN